MHDWIQSLKGILRKLNIVELKWSTRNGPINEHFGNSGVYDPNQFILEVLVLELEQKSSLIKHLKETRMKRETI